MYLNNSYYAIPKAISLKTCNEIINLGDSKNLEPGEIEDGDQENRSSKVSWIEHRHLELELMELIKISNKNAKWNFSLADFEPFQYTVYNKNDFYNWHIDSLSDAYANNFIRKLNPGLNLSNKFKSK